MASFKIEGGRELQKRLDAIAADVRSNVTRRALVSGAAVVKKSVKAAASVQPTLADAPFKLAGRVVQPGEIARNVGTSKVGYTDDGTGLVSVGVRSNAANGFLGRIASFNEFGTVDMPAQPFMRPGFESSKQAAVGAMVGAIRAGIDKA